MDKDEFGRESDPQRFHWCVKWPNCTSRIPALGAAVLTSAEYDALKADAARYRWLRDRGPDAELFIGHRGPSISMYTHSAADGMIDDAMAEKT